MADPASSNKREFSRSHVHVTTTVSRGATRVSGKLRDVSMKGVFVTCDASGLTGGEACSVEVVLSEEVRVSLKGHVVRAEPTGLAIVLDEIPVESFHHLQQLVIYNADDPERVERELTERLSSPPGAGSPA